MPRNSAPHFKVLCSTKNHSKLAAVYQDNRLFAGWVRLGLFAIEHYADRTGDEFIVPDRRLPEIFGVGRADIARTSLGRLADVSPISAERDGDVWRITWPNLAKKQFPRREDGTSRGGSASASASATTTKEENKESATADDVKSTRVAKVVKAPSEAATTIANALMTKLVEIGRPPRSPAKWPAEIDVWLRARDRPDPGDCLAVIEWLFDPGSRGNVARGQYALVIESPRALREKYTRALIAYQKEIKHGPATATQAGKDIAQAILARRGGGVPG